jgi:hypothetical protein
MPPCLAGRQVVAVADPGQAARRIATDAAMSRTRSENSCRPDAEGKTFREQRMVRLAPEQRSSSALSLARVSGTADGAASAPASSLLGRLAPGRLGLPARPRITGPPPAPGRH